MDLWRNDASFLSYNEMISLIMLDQTKESFGFVKVDENNNVKPSSGWDASIIYSLDWVN